MGVTVIPYEKTKVSYIQPHISPIRCKNCNAPLYGDKCEYCGSVYRKPTLEELEELQKREYEDIGNIPFLF